MINIFKDIHAKDRAFILCNGDSLNRTPDLSNEITIGLNRGYKARIPKYLVVVDRGIAISIKDEIPWKEISAIFTSKGLFDDEIINYPNVFTIRGTNGKRKFSRDISKPTYGGGTVTYLAIQIAYYMGVHHLYMVGLDHYKDKDTIKHFAPDYFKDNVTWNKPNIEKIEQSYKIAVKEFNIDNRTIYNASTYTYLPESIIPRIDLGEVL